jgi:hypothetical protein
LAANHLVGDQPEDTESYFLSDAISITGACPHLAIKPPEMGRPNTRISDVDRPALMVLMLLPLKPKPGLNRPPALMQEFQSKTLVRSPCFPAWERVRSQQSPLAQGESRTWQRFLWNKGDRNSTSHFDARRSCLKGQHRRTPLTGPAGCIRAMWCSETEFERRPSDCLTSGVGYSRTR